MIVILKPCKWNDSKVSKTVARVFLSLVQASEDLVFVDRGKLHPSAWVKDVCGIYMSVYHYYGFCNDQTFTSRFYFLCPLGIKGNLLHCTFLSLTLTWTKASFVY